MKKPKSPNKPQKPIEPVKEVIAKFDIRDIIKDCILGDIAGKVEDLLKNNEQVIRPLDVNKIKIEAFYIESSEWYDDYYNEWYRGTGEYYALAVVPCVNVEYDNQLKKYNKELAKYEIKNAEYLVKKVKYDLDLETWKAEQIPKDIKKKELTRKAIEGQIKALQSQLKKI